MLFLNKLTQFTKGRNKKILINSFFLFLLKLIALLNIIISVPLTLKHLDKERYGLYMAITSILSLLNLSDFGLGYGLQNSTSINFSNNNFAKLQKDISNIFFILLFISITTLLLYFYLFPNLDLVKFFNIKTILAKSEIGPAVTVLIVSFFIGLPFSIVQKIQIGIQKGYIPTSWQIVSTISSLLGVFWVTKTNPTIPNLLLCVSGINTFFIIINFIYFILIKNPNFVPLFKLFNLRESIKMGKTGLIFFILQMLSIICTASDSLIISHYKGAIQVAQFSIVQRLYMLMITPVQIFIEPLWPAYSEAIAKKDFNWINTIFHRSLLLSTLASFVLSIILILGGNFIIQIWLNDKSIIVEPTLLFAFSSMIFYSTITGSFCSILNTNEFIFKQLLSAIVTNISCLILKLFVIQYFQIWHMVVVTFVSFLLFFYFPNYIKLKKYLIINNV